MNWELCNIYATLNESFSFRWGLTAMPITAKVRQLSDGQKATIAGLSSPSELDVKDKLMLMYHKIKSPHAKRNPGGFLFAFFWVLIFWE